MIIPTGSPPRSPCPWAWHLSLVKASSPSSAGMSMCCMYSYWFVLGVWYFYDTQILNPSHPVYVQVCCMRGPSHGDCSSQSDHHDPFMSSWLGLSVDWLLLCHGKTPAHQNLGQYFNFSLLVQRTEVTLLPTLLKFMDERQQQLSYTLLALQLHLITSCVFFVAHQLRCWGFRPGSGLSWILPGGVPQRSIHRVSWPRNLQLLRQLIQLLARYHWRQWDVYVRQLNNHHPNMLFLLASIGLTSHPAALIYGYDITVRCGYRSGMANV